ncbi:hypothetical protein GE21DRAFT_1313270 [Neurospora crassa]|nr:hypothetical protein GE21DRAFT_1313270 [Neurospora crassa]
MARGSEYYRPQQGAAESEVGYAGRKGLDTAPGCDLLSDLRIILANQRAERRLDTVRRRASPRGSSAK